jgi:hypothetical protein
MAKRRTNSLSDRFVADLRQIRQATLERGLPEGETPYTPGTTQLDVWLKITAHALTSGVWTYTVETYTAALLAGTNARTSTNQKARNATPAGPIAVGQWVRSLGRELVAGDWIHVFSQSTGLFPVKVTKDGGSAGGASTTCSYTYTVASMDGVTIATAQTPDRPRFVNVEYELPADASRGVGYYDGDTFKLLEVIEERPKTDICEA